MYQNQFTYKNLKNVSLSIFRSFIGDISLYISAKFEYATIHKNKVIYLTKTYNSKVYPN